MNPIDSATQLYESYESLHMSRFCVIEQPEYDTSTWLSVDATSEETKQTGKSVKVNNERKSHKIV